jgi:hypothetical protein
VSLAYQPRRGPTPEQEASDPTTPGPRLVLLGNVERLRPLVRRNPNLPGAQLRPLLAQGDLDAWLNPCTDLVLFAELALDLLPGAMAAAGRLGPRLGWPTFDPRGWPRGRLAERLLERLALEGQPPAPASLAARPSYRPPAPLGPEERELVARLGRVLRA